MFYSSVNVADICFAGFTKLTHFNGDDHPRIGIFKNISIISISWICFTATDLQELMRELCEVAFRGIVRNQESLHAISISLQNDVDTYCILYRHICLITVAPFLDIVTTCKFNPENMLRVAMTLDIIRHCKTSSEMFQEETARMFQHCTVL